MLAFAALFVVGGWVSIGTPPKPFAPAEGLFVSGAWLQAVIMAPVLLGLTRPGAAPLAVMVDRALGLFWRLSGLCLLLVAALVFIWASGRALFDLGALPPNGGWSVLPAGLSRSEAWWLETTMAQFGLALCLSIPTLLRADGHVSLDVVWARFGPRTRRWVQRLGNLLLALPVGWVLLVQGTRFAARAWRQLETSANFGIEYVFVIKTAVPLLGFLLLVTAALNLRSPSSRPGQG